MNKSLKLVLIGVVVAVAGAAAYKFVDSNKISETSVKKEKTEQKENEIEKSTKSDEGTSDKKDSSQSEDKNESSKAEEKTDEGKIESISSDELNSKMSEKDGKTVVLFKDGTTITDNEINKGLDDVPEQLSAKMSLTEIKSFLAWREAYKKVITEAALRSGIMNSDEVKNLIEKRKKTAAGFMLLDDRSKELMTYEALKKSYDKVWDKNFKGTKEFSLTAITTADKAIAEKIKKDAKDEDSLKKILETNAAKVKTMEMDSRPQGMLPPEISDAVLKLDKNSNPVVGPFEVKGSFMLFYVKSVKDAQKREFTKEFAEEYKKAASRDFINEYMQNLYKKYDVKIKDIEGKTIDAFNIVNTESQAKETEKEQEAKLVKLSKLQDGDVLATYKDGKITVKDLKEFYKVDNILDQTFVQMAQQFKISLDKVILYAVKLTMDDVVLAKEVEATGYEKQQKVAEKLEDVEKMEAQHAYFKQNVKVTKEEIKQSYDKFIKSIPDEDKNDNEISVKLAFFETQEEADKAIKSISSGDEKFITIYKEKSAKKEAIDLGYVRKRGTSPELWKLLKTGASGTCVKQILEINSEQFGIKDRNYVLVYIADRRPVTLPSLSNEAEKNYFKRLAEREKAVDIAKTHLKNGVKTINGQTIEAMIKANPEYVDRMISVLLGYAG